MRSSANSCEMLHIRSSANSCEMLHIRSSANSCEMLLTCCARSAARRVSLRVLARGRAAPCRRRDAFRDDNEKLRTMQRSRGGQERCLVPPGGLGAAGGPRGPRPARSGSALRLRARPAPAPGPPCASRGRISATRLATPPQTPRGVANPPARLHRAAGRPGGGTRTGSCPPRATAPSARRTQGRPRSAAPTRPPAGAPPAPPRRAPATPRARRPSRTCAPPPPPPPLPPVLTGHVSSLPLVLSGHVSSLPPVLTGRVRCSGPQGLRLMPAARAAVAAPGRARASSPAAAAAARYHGCTRVTNARASSICAGVAARERRPGRPPRRFARWLPPRPLAAASPAGTRAGAHGQGGGLGARQRAGEREAGAESDLFRFFERPRRRARARARVQPLAAARGGGLRLEGGVAHKDVSQELQPELEVRRRKLHTPARASKPNKK